MDLTPEDPRTPQQSAQCPSAVTAEAETQVTAAELVMTRRRSLLKAAASVAPVLATLPNGAALANASAFQCATNELTALLFKASAIAKDRLLIINF